MANVSKIERHPEREAIEARIIEGATVREVADEHGVGKDAVHLHATKLRAAMAERARRDTEAYVATIGDKLCQIDEWSTEIVETAVDLMRRTPCPLTVTAASKALSDRAKLFGLDRTTIEVIQANSANGHEDSDEQREALGDVLARLTDELTSDGTL